jgi:hypothetical protein
MSPDEQDPRPRFPIGKRFRYLPTGSTWTIVRDWHPHPAVAQSAGITDDRYYVIETPGGESITYHELLDTETVVPIDDPPAEDDAS